MELRGFSHLHFISVIKGGEVIKFRNITREKTLLKFKNVEEIYVTSDSKCHDSLAKSPPKVNRSLAMPNGCDEVKNAVKIESIQDEDELNFGSITLKQLRKTCKSKKRKASKSVKLTAIKQGDNVLQNQEDELDLKETLVSLKRKLFKKTKAKKCITKCGSMSSELNELDSRSNNMPNDLDFHESSREMCEPMRIKVEDDEANYPQPQAINCIFRDDQGNSTSEVLGTVDPCCSDENLKTTLDEIQSGSLNQTCHDHLVLPVSLSVPNLTSSHELLENVHLQNPFISEKPEIDEIMMTCDVGPKTGFVECDSSDFQDKYPDYSCALQVPVCNGNSVEIQAPCTSPASDCQKVEFINHGEIRRAMDDDKYIDAEVIEDNQSSIIDVDNAPLRSSPDAIECFEDKEVPHTPERLLSGRKMISPSCQEKLCRAMNCIELQDDIEAYFCREKLHFEKYCEDESSPSRPDLKKDQITLTSKQREVINTSEVIANPMKAIRKAKAERKVHRSKGIFKGHRAPTGCSSVQSCSKNAIAFSQQQMNDIERLATKLMTELHSMKQIVVDTLHDDSGMGSKLRCNTDEVRVAVENATKVEETTKKWISMMTRDCNRFCKIMRLAEVDTISPEKQSPKERKKIIFADEAGGSLCHVKVFDADMDVASPLRSHIKNDHVFSA